MYKYTSAATEPRQREKKHPRSIDLRCRYCAGKRKSPEREKKTRHRATVAEGPRVLSPAMGEQRSSQKGAAIWHLNLDVSEVLSTGTRPSGAMRLVLPVRVSLATEAAHLSRDACRRPLCPTRRQIPSLGAQTARRFLMNPVASQRPKVNWRLGKFHSTVTLLPWAPFRPHVASPCHF